LRVLARADPRLAHEPLSPADARAEKQLLVGRGVREQLKDLAALGLQGMGDKGDRLVHERGKVPLDKGPPAEFGNDRLLACPRR
jgi:hypothetical protein